MIPRGQLQELLLPLGRELLRGAALPVRGRSYYWVHLLAAEQYRSASPQLTSSSCQLPYRSRELPALLPLLQCALRCGQWRQLLMMANSVR